MTMIQNNKRQKIKLLFLMEMLRQETDEQHPLTTSRICEKLGEFGVSCERRTVGMDVALLNECGFEVMSKMIGHEKGYYVEDRSFSIPELKIMIDAVQASNFITDRKTGELIDKISKLGGSHRGEILKGNMICFNTTKHSNESIYYNVEALQQALQLKRKASFCYFDLGPSREKIYRKEHRRYIVDPFALVYNDDNYYLMCYTEKYKAVTTYRVDRMDAVAIEEDDLTKGAEILEASVADYTEQVFRMYNGKQQSVTLAFDPVLLGAIFDKFGENTLIKPWGEGWYKTKVDVRISPTFWGWLFQFGSKIQILSPNTVREQYACQVRDALNQCTGQQNTHQHSEN